jgi:hypothetical protein
MYSECKLNCPYPESFWGTDLHDVHVSGIEKELDMQAWRLKKS